MAERYLADENFPRAALPRLAAAGIDIAHMGDIAPGDDDISVAAEAIRRDAVLLTFDRDFGEITFRHRIAVPGIVLFRLGQQPPWVVIAYVETFLTSARTLRRYFTVASLRRVRQRPIAESSMRMPDPVDEPRPSLKHEQNAKGGAARGAAPPS